MKHNGYTMKHVSSALLPFLFAAGLFLSSAGPSFGSGETVNLSIGKIPPGASITITFDAVVNRTMPAARTSVSNQATISGSNFSTVKTDDPDSTAVPKPQATVTPVVNLLPVAGFGKALAFEGAAQYAEILDGGSLTSPAYTVEAWVRPEAVNVPVLFRTDAAGSNYAMALSLDSSGRFVHTAFDSAAHQVTGSTVAETGRWYHVAATLSGGTLRLYINGIEEGTAVSGLGTLWSPADRFELGRQHAAFGGSAFTGQLDELRIWNAGLSAAELQAWMYRGIDATALSYANLAACYKFNETAGSVATDLKGGTSALLYNMTDANHLDSGVQAWYTSEDTAVTGQFIGSDDDGTSTNGLNWAPGITFEIVSQGTKGQAVTGSGNSFTYTPAADQNGDDSFQYRVTDPLSAASNVQTQTIHIAPVNDAPVLNSIGSRTVKELETLTFTATGTDKDSPVNALVFSLSGAPAGAVIDPATGIFTWTPTETQGPGAYTFDIVVTDNGTPPASDSETITVTVQEVNSAPALGTLTNRTVNELALLSFTVTATDSDLPANTLAFSLNGAPSGAAINPSSGVFTWTPAEDQAPGAYTFDIIVTDNGSPALSDSRPVTITVSEVNSAPVLNPIGNKVVDELTLLTFTATATDSDIPVNNLAFTLDPGAPAGAVISSAGLFSWTPTEAQGPGVYPVTVRVTDNGTPPLSAAETISITVNEVCSSGSITVTSGADDGAGTLRQAIPDLCPGGVIDFALPGPGPHVLLLTSGELQISKNMTLSGPGAADLTISGGNSQRIFSVGAGVDFTVKQVTITSGAAGNGAGLLNNGGTVTVDSSEITSCTSSADGGAIYNQAAGTLTVINSTLTGNQALNGGGIYNALGAMVLTNTTITANTAAAASAGKGGGIYNNTGLVTLVNSTVYANTAAETDGGIHNEGGTATLRNSLIAGSTAGSGPDIGGAFVSEGYNLIQDAGTAVISGPATGDIYGQDPHTGLLRINGGSTRTLALLAGSPALNIIPSGTSSCGTTLVTDQRSAVRPQGGGCDIGAYEFIPDTTTILVSSANPSTYGDSVTFTATVSDSEAESGPSGTVTFTDGAGPIAACTGISLSAGSAVCSLSSLTGGLQSITASYSGDTSFSGSISNTVAQTVNQADQTISFTAPTDMPAGTAPFTVSASAAPGLVVSLQSLTLPVCSVSGSTVTLTNLAGLCTLRATQNGDLNYQAAAPVSRSFNVFPAALNHINIAPALATISAGGSQSYTAEGFDQYNNSRGDMTATTVFSISPDGSCFGSSCSAVIAGGHIVTGSSNGKTAPASLTVNPGPVALFSVSGPASVTGGLGFSLMITATDAYTNTVTGYTGTVHFTSTDGLAALPADYTFTGADSGTHTFGSAVLRTVGLQTVSVRDTLAASLTGSLNILVDLFKVTGTVASGSGTIACLPAALTYGDGFTCTACPARGYDLYRLYDTGVNRTAACVAAGDCYSYAGTNVTANRVIKTTYLNFPVILLFGASSDTFAAIQPAADAAQTGDRIQVQLLPFVEQLNFNRPGVTAALEGGYDPGFTVSAGHTVITGSLTITDGTLTVRDVTIQ